MAKFAQLPMLGNHQCSEIAPRQCEVLLCHNRLEIVELPVFIFAIARGSPYDWYALPILAAFTLVAVGASKWRFFIQAVRGIRGSSWPAVPGVIDIVSVIEERGDEGEMIGYLATLTYFYRSPELQTGDFSRMFGADEQVEAEAWAASYKGSSVTVHVDPRDPTRSVLRAQDL